MKFLIKKILRETLLNEIDWEDTFSDVRKTCVEPKALVEYLNKVRGNKDLGYSEREKFDAKFPFIHSKSTFFKDKPTGVDVDYFIDQITKKPKNLVNTNEKILKSGGPHEYVYKTGVPAFRGIVYDIDKDKFYYINTCPGAGDCVLICYALKGNYIRYAASYDSMTRRLNYLLNYPDKNEKQLYDELKTIAIEHKALAGYKSKVLLRWNDSGDLLSEKFFKLVMDVIKATPNVDHYIYTKEVALIKAYPQLPDNVIVNFSYGGIKPQENLIDPAVDKVSHVVDIKDPTKEPLLRAIANFKYIVYDKQNKKWMYNDVDSTKHIIAQRYKIREDSILTVDELNSTPKGKIGEYNVIVLPGESDAPASRRDVLGTYLIIH
jgi:hypothetical protein